MVDATHGVTLDSRTRIGAASVFATLVLWQLAGSLPWPVADELSTPFKVAQAFVAMIASGELGSNLGFSLLEFVQGFIPAVVAGLAFGLAYSLFPRFRYLVEPLFICLYTTPLIAFIPIVVLCFGVGAGSKAVMVFISAFVPIAINTSLGITEVHESWVRACRSFGANGFQILSKALIPGALPGIMSGMRLAVGRGMVALIAAEMYASMHGLGRLIQTYGSTSDTTSIFVLVAVISGIGFTAVSQLRALEQRLLPWRLEHDP